MKIKKGDRVNLSKSSFYYDQCRGLPGTVIKLKTYLNSETWVEVQWDKPLGSSLYGIRDNYPWRDLIPHKDCDHPMSLESNDYTLDELAKTKEEFGL